MVYPILSAISLTWCFSSAWLLRNGCHTTVRNDLVLFLVMLFLHTKSLALSALTPSLDKFQFQWVLFGLEEKLLHFLPSKLAFITLEREICMNKSLPVQISLSHHFSPSAQPLAGNSLPSLLTPDSHHTEQFMCYWLPPHHWICLCI